MTNDVKIKFESKDKSLYDLAYLSIDLNQVLVFGELLNDNNFYELYNLYFNEGAFKLTRQNHTLRYYSENIKIVSIKEGCIEIILTGISILSSALITYLGIVISNKIKEKDEKLLFEINPNDKELNDLINKYDKGDFGKDGDSLNWLIMLLAHKGYSTEIITQDAFRIQKVIDKYEQRITKIITKN